MYTLGHFGVEKKIEKVIIPLVSAVRILIKLFDIFPFFFGDKAYKNIDV